jgi:hypothetical protein
MRSVDRCKVYCRYNEGRSLFPHYDPADGLHNDTESYTFYLSYLQGHQDLLRCGCEGDHTSISNALLDAGFGAFPIWSLVVAVSELAAGAVVYVFLGVTSLDATLQPVRTWSAECCLLRCYSCSPQLYPL